jgi:hypothetical protein
MRRLVIIIALTLQGCMDGFVDIDDKGHFCEKIISQEIREVEGWYEHVVVLECSARIERVSTPKHINSND